MNKYPKLRTHTKRGRKSQVWTSWWYDMRGTGKPDIPLGSNHDEALKKWDEIHNRKPRITGTLEEAFEQWEREVLPRYDKCETLRDYTKSLRQLRPVFGPATWESVTLPDLNRYLKARTGKTRANREISLLSLIWNWARVEALTDLPWPASGMGKARWKNKERARQVEVTDAAFAAVYEAADQMLRDCLDLATATGLRLTDCRTVQIPPGDTLRVTSSKTNKVLEFAVSDSPVLAALVAKRKTMTTDHLMLLTAGKSKVSARMLRTRWDEAREKAAKANPQIADELRAMYLRDMRKRAAQLATDVSEASRLLQHSSTHTTRKHYRAGDKVRPVR